MIAREDVEWWILTGSIEFILHAVYDLLSPVELSYSMVYDRG